MTPRSDDAAPERSAGDAFRVPLDIIVAPARAFETLAADPRWLPSYFTVIALCLAGGALQIPAMQHVFAVAKNPPITPLPTPDQLAVQILIQEALTPLLSILIVATTLTTFVALAEGGKGVAVRYASFVSLASASTVINGLGEFLGGVGVRLHDPASYSSMWSVLNAFPATLGPLASPDNDRQLAFLSHFGVFDVWSNIVLAFGFARLSGMKVLTGLILAFSLDLGIAIFFG